MGYPKTRYDHILGDHRQGDGAQVQMYGGDQGSPPGAPTAGNAAVFDAGGNVIDGGVAPGGTSALQYKAVFQLGIGGVQEIGNDVCPPRRVSSYELGTGTLLKFEARAKTAPVGAPLTLDVQRSSNGGASWTSLFTSPPSISDGSSAWISITSFAAVTLAADDWLRIDVVTGSAENAQNITAVLWWE